MRTVVISSLALTILGLYAGCAEAQRGRGGASPQEAVRQGWLSDYGQARDRARQTGKPIMLVFRCVP
jgi:hypothetical protein